MSVETLLSVIDVHVLLLAVILNMFEWRCRSGMIDIQTWVHTIGLDEGIA